MESSEGRKVTLIDLLKLMAIIMPCVWIVTYSPRLGLWGVIAGLFVGATMAVLQFLGFIHFDSWLDRRWNETEPPLVSLLAYYLGTLVTGIACSLVTLEVARFVAQATIT